MLVQSIEVIFGDRFLVSRIDHGRGGTSKRFRCEQKDQEESINEEDTRSFGASALKKGWVSWGIISGLNLTSF